MIISAEKAVIDGELKSNVILRISKDVVEDIAYNLDISPDLQIMGTLIPSFIDIHCHGGKGQQFSDNEFDKTIEYHKSKGTGFLLASLVSDSHENLKSQVRNLTKNAENSGILGIHLEGPYISKARSGAHSNLVLRNPSWNEISELLDLSNGQIKMVTIAPELDGAIKTIEKLSNLGIIAAIGHFESNITQVRNAIEAGSNLVTHFTNGMPKLDSTLAREILDETNLNLEIILDRVHVPDDEVQEIINSASERIICVTDAMSAAGVSDGDYSIGELRVQVRESIARTNAGKLAGSTMTMQTAFLNLVNNFRMSVPQAVNATSSLAAKLLDLKNIGEIKVGNAAMFNVFANGEIKTIS